MGDALHYIDFHQLQIENKQYVSRIEERNDELLKVTHFRREWGEVLNTIPSNLQGVVSIARLLQISRRANFYSPWNTRCIAEGFQIS